MTIRRITMTLTTGLIMLTCFTCRAEHPVGMLNQSLAEQAFLDKQWIFFKGIDVSVGHESKSDSSPLERAHSKTKKELFKFESFQVNKNILNIAAGLIGVGVGLGHSYMDQDEAKMVNLATLSLGMSTMMRGLRGLSNLNQETVKIRGLKDLSKTSLGGRHYNMSLRPAVSLDSSVGIQLRVNF